MSTGPIDPTTPVETPEALTAADVMMPASRTCSPFSTVTEAVMFFKDQDTDVIPVVDEGKPIGVVVDRDVALAVGDADAGALPERPVTEIMVTDFPTVSIDAPVDQVLQAMSAAGSRLALVVDGEELLSGLIFWAELARRLCLDETSLPGTIAPAPADGASQP
ncbi:CBS domain-containing protein [Paludisphaera sp.]|uniref:CBS domain-containing protein n=1 Tax=Paludisphaera sp. TaxID=2017432 RepID=UPI00301BBE22